MRINKKYILVIFLVLVFVGIKLNDYYTPDSFVLGERYEYELNNVEKIRIRNGGDGSSFETTDPHKINELIDIVKVTVFTLSDNQETCAGWTYYIDFYEHIDEESWFRVTIGSQPISYHNKKVDSSKNDKRNYDIEDGKTLVMKLEGYLSSYK